MNTPDGKEITDQLLCRRFPHLFAARRSDMRTTCMCWGFDIGPGWMGILYDAAAQLEPLIVEHIAKYPYQIRFPAWIFSRYNMHISWQWRCYSLLAIWEWVLLRLGLRQPQPWWPRASQVKEKYAILRFYLTSGTNEMYAIVNKAESQSAETCEACGRPGKIRGRGWYYTRCAACWRKGQK